MDPLTAQPAAVGANRRRARGAPPLLSFAAEVRLARDIESCETVAVWQSWSIGEDESTEQWGGKWWRNFCKEMMDPVWPNYK
jgi:hypothetical protein